MHSENIAKNYPKRCQIANFFLAITSVVTVSETDTAKTVRRRNLGFSAIIEGFWAHLHAKII